MALIWDDAYSLGATVSLGGTLATMDNNVNPGQGGIRANVGKSSGKWYFEVDIILFDGIVVGVTSTNAHSFPGNDSGEGLGFFNSGYFHNSLYNGGGTINFNAPMRVGVKVDFDAHTIEIVGPGHPEGTDVLNINFNGATLYPSLGTGYGTGVSHPCSGIIYGDVSQFTVTHDASFLPWEPVASVVDVRDWRLVGATNAVVSSTSHYAAISSPHTRRVVLASPSVGPLRWVDSGALDAAPGALVHTTLLWTVCDDGQLRKLNTSTAALISTVDVGAANTSWLHMNTESVLIAPGRKGEVCTVTGTTPTDTVRVLSDVVAAVYTSTRYLYCFSNAGLGAIVAVTSAGVLTKVGEFTATGCRDIVRAKLMPDGLIAVACRDRVVSFDISDPLAPVVDAVVKPGSEVFSVADDNDHTPVTATTDWGLTEAFPVTEAVFVDPYYILLSPSPFAQVAV